MVSRAIESAQSRIEGFNFDARKHVLEYDDVMNKQRTAIYNKRREMLLLSNEDEQKKILKLRVIDLLWMEHIESMEHMRSSVRLRAYGQRDPLVEYKKEGARMFQELLVNIDLKTEEMLSKMNDGGSIKMEQQIPTIPKIQTPVSDSNINRNDPCYCGSGKKYKKCHGK